MIGAPTICFGCGERFELALLELLGDAVFCRACLGKMLRRVDKRSASAGVPGSHGRYSHRGSLRVVEAGTASSMGPASAGDRAAVARTSAADGPCFVCGESLDGIASIKLRGFAICVRCARGLSREDAALDAGADLRVAAINRFDDAAIGDPRGEPPAGSVTDTLGSGPGSGIEWCSRCGRTMPGPGSYQLVDGRPYCARCVAARARLASPMPAPDTDSCDACGRLLPAGPVPEISGFWLCAACRNSDPDLALALARVRHQRRLARAYHRLVAEGTAREHTGDND